MRLFMAGLMAVAAGVIYILYMVFSGGGSFSQVLGFMMAMGNTYGVLLITVLMGNGLVALPKRLWTMGSTDNELHRLYMSVSDALLVRVFPAADCETHRPPASRRPIKTLGTSWRTASLRSTDWPSRWTRPGRTHRWRLPLAPTWPR